MVCHKTVSAKLLVSTNLFEKQMKSHERAGNPSCDRSINLIFHHSADFTVVLQKLLSFILILSEMNWLVKMLKQY